MKDLYFCTGQYHVFCVLLFKLIDNKENNGDLVICDCFEGAKKIYNSLCSVSSSAEKSNGYFDNIIFIDNVDYKELEGCKPNSKIGKLFKSIVNRCSRPKNTLKHFLSDSYSRIYIAGAVQALVEYCLYEYYSNNCKIILYDDGLGPRIQWTDLSRNMKIFDYSRKAEFWNYVNKKTFFSPERVCDVYPHIFIDKQCKPIDEVVTKKGIDFNRIKNILNYVFKYVEEDNPFIDNDILYFASGFDLYSWLDKYSAREVQIANEIGKKVSNFVIKRHPNSKETYNESIKKISNICMPEVLYLNTDIENKLLISSISTSVFNPSFIYDKNPYLILTYKLLGNIDEVSNDLYSCSENELEKRLRITLYSGYKNKNKIYIPNSIEELFSNIDDYISKTKTINAH